MQELQVYGGESGVVDFAKMLLVVLTMDLMYRNWVQLPQPMDECNWKRYVQIVSAV